MKVRVTAETAITEIEQELRAAESRGFCGLVLLRAKKSVLLSSAYGWADREAGKRMTMETGIEIGSIVKPLTLAALLRLTESGLLDLQDTLDQHFEQVPKDKLGITLEMVARHQAGFRDMFGGDYQLARRDWLVRRVLDARLVAPPGTQDHYSNSGYSLLAALVEMKAGVPFETYVRKEVLEPAGVMRIGYRLAGWKKEELAVGYRRFGMRRGTPLDHRWLEDGPGWNLRGNGGMLATAADLSAWYEALWEGKVLGTEALAKFLSIDAGESKKVGGMALAHAGGNGIFNCLQVCYFVPAVYLTLFSSTAGVRAESLYRKILEPFVAIAKACLP